ncbi:MAG TPA: MFS transporter [Nevskiaceae bacterium]
METSSGTGAASRVERLQALPLKRLHVRLLGGAGVGWAMDAVDVGLISFVMAALAKTWPGITTRELSWLGSIGFIGMALGAACGGLLADRFGRRHVFALTLLIYGVATGASALAGSLTILLLFRFIVGLGLGAELPVASTLVSEFAPARIRGRMVVVLEAFWAVGWFAAALIGYLVVANANNGWRWGLAIGAVPALWAVIVRLHLPESVHFLERSGRAAAADRVVRAFERSPSFARGPAPRITDRSDHGHCLPPSTPDGGATPPTAAQRLRTLFHRDYRQRSVGLWGIWFLVNFAYYGAFIWLPTLLVSRGIPLSRSFEYTLIITAAQIPGYAVAAWLIERWGRRPTLSLFLCGSAASAYLFALAAVTVDAGSVAPIVTSGCLLSFFALGAWGAVYAVGPEMYPTAIRGTGTGAAAAFGRIASIIAPLSVVWVQNAGGSWQAVFTIFAAAYLLAAGFTFLLVERRGKALE